MYLTGLGEHPVLRGIPCKYACKPHKYRKNHATSSSNFLIGALSPRCHVRSFYKQVSTSYTHRSEFTT